MRRIAFPLFIGLAGTLMLVALGIWQVQRLTWKQGVLTQIEERIAADPAPLPYEPVPEEDRYQPVRLQGNFGTGSLRVLVSRKTVGAGYRIIVPFDTGERRVLVDLGFVSIDAPIPKMPANPVITGNLHWPDERSSGTPENDVAENIWFARDVGEMAAQLGTEPLLIIAREIEPAIHGITPLPVSATGIPNNHLQYVITWFSLAVIWLGMTGYYLYKNARNAKG